MNVEDIKGRRHHSPLPERTPHSVLPCECGGCRQKISNQYVWGVCNNNMNIFCVVYASANKIVKIQCPSYQRAVK